MAWQMDDIGHLEREVAAMRARLGDDSWFDSPKQKEAWRRCVVFVEAVVDVIRHSDELTAGELCKVQMTVEATFVRAVKELERRGRPN
jgi:hypothetical protein